MERVDDGSVILDVYFLEHLIECVKKQKIIHRQSNEVRAEWQAIIDMTIEQVDDIVQAQRSLCVLKNTASYGPYSFDQLVSLEEVEREESGEKEGEEEDGICA